MKELLLHQEQLNYIGLFSKPVFSLWGKGPIILEGLHSAFAQFKVNLTDLRQESFSPVVSEASATVLFGTTGNYKFKFDRIESSHSIFAPEDVTRFFAILEHGERWLRPGVPSFSFQTHLFTYQSHSSVSEGTGKECLAKLPQIELGDIGINLGNGIILNWLDPALERRFQLILDHSHIVSDGLFIQFSAHLSEDRVDYQEFAKTGKTILSNTLARLGLTIESEG